MNAFGSLMATINGYERQTTEVKISTGVIVKFPKDWQEWNGRGKNTSTAAPRFNSEWMQALVVPTAKNAVGRKYHLFIDDKA